MSSTFKLSSSPHMRLRIEITRWAKRPKAVLEGAKILSVQLKRSVIYFWWKTLYYNTGKGNLPRSKKCRVSGVFQYRLGNNLQALIDMICVKPIHCKLVSLWLNCTLKGRIKIVIIKLNFSGMIHISCFFLSFLTHLSLCITLSF